MDFWRVSRIRLKKGDRFVKLSAVCHKIGLIESDLMMCVYPKNGNQMIEEFANETNFITNYYSFLTRTPLAKEITCLEDCTVWVLSRPHLEKLSKEHPFIYHGGQIGILKRIIHGRFDFGLKTKNGNAG